MLILCNIKMTRRSFATNASILLVVRAIMKLLVERSHEHGTNLQMAG